MAKLAHTLATLYACSFVVSNKSSARVYYAPAHETDSVVPSRRGIIVFVLFQAVLQRSILDISAL